ncbi:MAG: hypothetical protein Q8O67_03645 [Deltaproteobacteria bacterium]|nr:hypothetical protein [Deltaproteobacteria bacterium]
MRLVLVAALSAGFASSCVKDDGSVFVEGAVKVDPAANPRCSAEADASVFLPNGLLDVLEPRGFNVALQVVTNLPSTFNNTDVTKNDSQSPNYVDYGSTDNNIIIMESAEIDFVFQVGADDVATVEAAQIDGDQVFNCNGTTCAAVGQKPAVSGTVFNEQTTLSSSSIVFLEALSATDGQAFGDALDGVLEFPNDRARIVANIRLKGTTTGNGDLRPITTFTFPFPIDLCKGCLLPNAEFCDAKGGAALEAIVAGDTCFPGQDDALFVCRCDDGSVVGGADCL